MAPKAARAAVLEGSATAEISLIAVTFFWGSTFTLVQTAIQDASTLAFLAARFSLGAVLLAVLYRLRRLRSHPHSWKPGLAAGLCLWAGYYLQTTGLRYTTPSKSAFLTSLCVVMVPLLAAIVYKIVPARAETAGAILAVAGTALMAAGDRLSAINAGDVLTVGAALAFAAHILVLGYYAPRIGFESLSVWQIAVVAAGSALTCGWAEPFEWRWSRPLLFAIAFTGVFCTALAFTVQAWAQGRTSPARTALIFALEPVFAAATSWAVAGERLPARAVAGAGLILAGVLAAELKPERSKRHPV